MTVDEHVHIGRRGRSSEVVICRTERYGVQVERLASDGELVSVCGRCECWWYVDGGGSVEEALRCVPCQLHYYAQAFGDTPSVGLEAT